MRFDRLSLENFKCYEDVDVRLDRGVTVIHGLNGSGKSSLLEACFFALYGSKALDSRLDEIVTIGTEQASVELWFTHDRAEYHVERRIRVRDERAQTTKCVLETPNSETVEGAKDVRARIGELLRMDAEAFVNCAYVRQGEVNKLINASPGQRQDMIDDLLQLGRLEEYRERASNARVGVGRVRDNKEGELAGLTEQIDEKEDEDLHARLNEYQTKRAEIEEEIDHLESEREEAISQRDNEAQVLEEADEQREEITALADDIEALRSNIERCERERNTMGERRRELRENANEKRERLDTTLDETQLDSADTAAIEEQISTLEARDDELLDQLQERQLQAQEQSNRATQLDNEAEERERQSTEATQEADELEATIEERTETLTERRAKLESLREGLSEKRERFEDAPCDLGSASEYRHTVSEEQTKLREREAERRSELSAARDAVDEAERLKSEGKCPECGQPVDGSPHVEAIDERRERVRELESTLDEIKAERATADERLETADALVELETEIERLDAEITTQEQFIENETAAISKEKEQVTELRETATTRSEAAKQKRNAAIEARERAEECRTEIGEINAERQTITERIDRLETLESLLDDIDAADTEIERLRERREELSELNEERREHLAEKRQRKTDLEEQFDEARIEEAKAEKERAQQYIESVDETLPDLTDERDTLQGKIGAVQNEIKTLEELRERHEELSATVERLTSLYEETEQLQTMYADLRSELRQRNVQTLERLLNETFGLIYQNDSYARIELDGEYELTVYEKDGNALDPEQLSGGERALFNLSLRCAVYRLLAEGIEGAAPMPPLILDEPTVFLDSGHVSKLLDLITSMRDIGVEQIVVVSHDEKLVGAADDLVKVAKDPTTNRSTIERREALSVAD